jgi:plasmid maintenance system killer protein
VIQTFCCKDSETLYAGENAPRFRSFHAKHAKAERKLQILDVTHSVEDCRYPPLNWLAKTSEDG